MIPFRMITVGLIVQVFLSVVGSTASDTVASTDGCPSVARKEDQSLSNNEIFEIAASTLELISSRRCWSRAKSAYGDEDVVRITDIKRDDLKEFSNWRLESNSYEVKAQNALKRYFQSVNSLGNKIVKYIEKKRAEKRAMVNVESELTGLYSTIADMNEEEFGKFIKYGSYFTCSNSFAYEFINYISRSQAMNINRHPKQETVLEKLGDWIDSKYDRLLREKCGYKYGRCKNWFTKEKSHYPVVNRTPRFNIIFTAKLIKLIIFPTKIDGIKSILKHLVNRMGPDFPIQEVELRSIKFTETDYPLSVLKSSLLKYVTRVEFSSCSFKDGIFRMDSGDRWIMNRIKMLSIMNFGDGNFTGIEGSRKLLKGIECLKICGYRFTELPPALFLMKGLRRLEIIEGPSIKIPPEISKLKSLRILKIRPVCFGRVVSMEDPVLDDVNLVEILSNMKNLEAIWLINTKVYIDDKKDFVNNSLRYLSIQGCSLKQIPTFIYRSVNGSSCLPRLEVLNLFSNHITDGEVEDILEPERMPPITRVTINFSKLTRIPRWVFNLKDKIEMLDLSCNSISSIPDELLTLKSLNMLSMSSNKLTGIPDNIHLLSQLTKLYLNGNQIPKIPEALWKLEQLESLGLAENELISISDDIRNLSRLSSLSVSNNHIRVFPEGLKECRSLSNLYLNFNRLQQLPLWLEQYSAYFPSLRNFNVTDNPFAVTSIPDLERLSGILRGNRIDFFWRN